MRNPGGSGLVSRKGRKAAPATFKPTLKAGAATQPFRDTRPLPQGQVLIPSSLQDNCSHDL
ncbi:hypothetical protein DMX06_21025 [Pseudomonas mosselii]|nr:hypothetical protein DMX06_21025 [Pseudomonas mosselii]